MTVSAKAIIVYKSKFLLLKPKGLLGSINGWDIPGGAIRKNEPLEKGLLREIEEETQIKVEDPVFISSLIMPDSPTKYEIFLCKSNTSKVILSKEHTRHRWVDKNEFFELTGFDLNSTAPLAYATSP